MSGSGTCFERPSLVTKWEPGSRARVRRVFVQRMKTRWGLRLVRKNNPVQHGIGKEANRVP